MSLIGPRRRPGDPPIPKAYGGCGCSCHRMVGVKHCVPCCYPNPINAGDMSFEDVWIVGPPFDTEEAMKILDLIEKSKMDPKYDHLNELLEDSDRPDAGKPR